MSLNDYKLSTLHYCERKAATVVVSLTDDQGTVSRSKNSIPQVMVAKVSESTHNTFNSAPAFTCSTRTVVHNNVSNGQELLESL